jgi:hypothetical protein
MLESLARSGDYIHLESEDEYSAYFQHLNRVFAFLSAWYQKLVEGGNAEAKIVNGFLEKLLWTVRALRFKHLYSNEHQLALDLNDSGFPHWCGISELEADLALQSQRLERLPSKRIVQEMMLEKMLRKGQDPIEFLPQMAEIQFTDELDGSKLVFPFTPGNLVKVENGSEEKGIINCLFSWLCYDKFSNRPYIYVMAFDFCGTEEELQFDFEQGDFLPAIRRLGDRVVPLAVLATDIDETLPRIFPKILKRIGLGPIICPRFSVKDGHPELVDWLCQFGEPGDFALLLESGVIFSQGQFEESRGWFSSTKKVRQIFAISEDELTGESQASQTQRVVLLPHHVLQQISTLPEFAEKFGTYSKVTYNQQGGLYVV